MKKFLFFIIFIFSHAAFAQTKPIYVAAPNGLSLREAPNKESKRIELLPYGTIISNYSFENKNAYETIDGYSGFWVKASTENGKTGYIFDGYTLPVKPPVKGEAIETYFENIFGKIVFIDSLINDVDSDDYYKVYIKHYKSGVIYEEAYKYEAYECSVMNINIMGAEKAYLWYYLIEEYVWGNGNHLMNKINYPTKTIETDTLQIYTNPTMNYGLSISKDDGSFRYVKLFYQNGFYTITWGSYI